MYSDTFKLLPADQFTFEQLTEAYNDTRVDYLVPMPMNEARLREYLHVNDVDLSRSWVAINEEEMIMGLGMLGFREDSGWITRLGVLPFGRRLGIGSAVLGSLLAEAGNLGLKTVSLEVIQGNTAGHCLFKKVGFVEGRELVVARRPPDPHTTLLPGGIKRATPLSHEEAIILLSHRMGSPNWLLQTESMRKARNLSALLVELENGGRGWVSYHASLFQLTRIVVEVTVGDPAEVTATILRLLHRRYKRQDAKVENIPDDEVWLGFLRAGYFESFRRIEMVKEL
jgi:ribosomal protein S18 acetylase RimI-like enzyme